MRASDLDRLMTAALDGEATPEETAALERALAGDPALRDHHNAWQRLFAALDRVPAAYPPEGLVAAVMANIPAGGRPPADQLPSPASIFGVGSNPFSLGGTMSEQTSGSFNKRKLVLAVGLAAIAVVVIAGYSLDMPPGSKDTIGTILPAERFVKPQQTAVDVSDRPPTQLGKPALVPPAADAAATAEGRAKGNTQGAALSQTRDQAESTAQGRPLAQPRDQAEGKARDQAEGKARDQAEGKARDQAEGKPQGKTMGTARDQAEGKPLAQPRSEAESQAKGKPLAQPRAEAEATPRSQTLGATLNQAQSQAKSQTQGAALSQTQGQVKSQAEGLARGQTEGIARSTAHSQAKSQTQAQTAGTALNQTQGTVKSTAQ